MGWKDWPYWIRGLFIGFIVGIGWVSLAIIVDGFKFITAKVALGFTLISIIIFCFVFSIAGLLTKWNWPYFVKGTAIGASFYIITIIVFWIGEMLSCGGKGLCGLFTAWSAAILWVLIPLFALIGWIYGKIKKR